MHGLNLYFNLRYGPVILLDNLYSFIYSEKTKEEADIVAFFFHLL